MVPHDKSHGRRLSDEGLVKHLRCPLCGINLYMYAIHCIAYPTAQAMLLGEAIDEGAKAYALHQAFDVDMVGWHVVFKSIFVGLISRNHGRPQLLRHDLCCIRGIQLMSAQYTQLC